MQDVMYIKIGGYIWKLFEDGHLELLAPGETVPEGEVVITDVPPETILKGTLLSSGTSAVTTIFGNVDRDGDETIPQAGFRTYTLPDSTESVENPSTLVQRLSSEAAITIEVNDDENLEDSFVNRFENPSVDFFGTTFEIDDDWTVELALIDSSGQVFISQSIVVGGVWELPDQDLTPLAEGPFIAVASVTDFYGNRVSSSTTSVKDTLAEGVSVEGDTGDDTIIDMFEAPAAQLSGEFAHVQAGANIDLYVTDIAGTELKFSTTLNADGTWSLVGDLSSLVEGTLTLRSETIDLAGNPAQISNTVELFLSPTITVNNDDPDGVFNQYEAPTEVFYGTTLNVEDGQTVTVTVSSSGGGSPLVLTTTVVNQTWTIDPYDVSSLPDGTLTITADTVNLAGQPAQDQINWRLDQTADIDAQFIDPNTDGVYNALEAMAASVIGNVIDIEDGQPVAIQAEDTAGNVIRGTGVVSGGSWASIDFDVSAAAPGELKLTILGIDVAGNRVNATATIDYDPIAIIDDIADDPADADQIFNLDQVTNKITLAGSTDNIETGQPLVITISDGVNPDVVINTVSVQGATGIWSDTGPGTWTTATNGVDISSLNDGDLTVTITGSDVAGNPALGTDTIHKDTIAVITVQFDQAIYEANNVETATVSGTVTDVERGQKVSVSITDTAGNGPVSLMGTVGLGGRWTGDASVDLSVLLDGTLTVDVSVLDVAGNEATATNTAPKDAVTITILNDDDGVGSDYTYDDGTFNQYESPTTSFYGVTTFVDDGSTVTLEITDGTTTVTETVTVSGNAWRIDNVDLSGLDDGTLTATATVTNSLGDTDSANLNRELDQTAAIDAEFVDPNTDGVYNALEAMAAALLGNVTDIEDGQLVDVTVEDSLGQKITGTGTVSGGTWSTSGLDLSAAEPGTLTLTIEGRDVAGNLATATATIDYDPIAVIDDLAIDDQDSDADQLFNAAEVGAGITLEGTTSGIETGQSLTITISDGVNPDVVVNSSVAGATGTGSATGAGSWITALNDVDLSALNDGDLTVTITGEDVAGNPATGTDTIHKDTLAAITVQFDGDGQLSASEITAVSISGTTTDIEAGQTVTVTISGGTAADIVFDAIIQADGSYSSLNNATDTTYDLSGFDDGTLTVDVAVEDVAGNPATATNTTIKDVVVEIDIDTGANGLDVAAIKSGSLTDYSGTTDAEDGQTVTLTISDGVNSQSQTSTVSSGAWSITGLLPTGLVANSEWTLTATVDDQAGNTATDSTPTIIQPTTVILAEANVSFVPDVAVSQILSQIDADPAFNPGPYTFSDAARQVDFDSLTSSDGSGDSTTRVEVSPDGKTIQLIRNGDNFVVIEGVIDDTSGSVTLTLRGGIEQAPGLNAIASNILIQTTENDVSGDPNADVVESELRFVIRDTSLEFAVDDAYQVVEDTTTTGDLFANDNLQEGPLTIQSIRFNGTDYSVSTTTPAVITDATGILTVNSSGTWSFEAARNQDNST
uniref:beta strand repeat-containing protein n=1 Tax=Pseudomaricurvus sp. TaxID=2004510 RepID=UPI003F6ACB49